MNFLMFQNNLQNRDVDVFRASEQIQTGLRINRPSDDPVGAAQALSFADDISRTKQYQKNLVRAETILKTSEAAYRSVTAILNRAKELQVQASDPTINPKQRGDMAKELNNMLPQLQNIMNVQVDGEYVFSGYLTHTQPFTVAATIPQSNVVTYNGDSNLLTIPVGDGGITLQAQSSGQNAVLGTGSSGVNIFQTISDLSAQISAPQTSSTQSQIRTLGDALVAGLAQVQSEVTNVGALTNRLDLTRDHLSSLDANYETFEDGIAQVDFARAATEQQRSTMALQATIKSAGAIMNMPSLMEFIGR